MCNKDEMSGGRLDSGGVMIRSTSKRNGDGVCPSSWLVMNGSMISVVGDEWQHGQRG